MATADPRLIVGLDYGSVHEARAMVERLGDLVSYYKVGLTLLAADGMALSRELRAEGKQVFQDWKLHDIGAQVEGAAAAIAASGGADLFNVHAEPQVMAAAVRGRGASPARLIAVTVLTSLSDADLREIGYRESARELVARRVRQAVDAGCDGVVASAQEAQLAREIGGPEFLIVTPGVRPAGSSADDQARTATPRRGPATGRQSPCRGASDHPRRRSARGRRGHPGGDGLGLRLMASSA
jgi:orotidine-5'-phosphate decarboxylase